jgi:DNA-binding SARP family transcriptional activator/tetratricopeptide (TPR) repeat protein
MDPSAQMAFATALFLILERAVATPRQELAELLWPTATREAANHRLRQTLLKLRQSGLHVESIGKTRIRLADDQIVVDYEHWESDTVDVDSQSTQQLTPFSGFKADFSHAYAAWLDRKKDLIVSHLVRGLLSNIAKNRHSGDWASVELFASALLQIAPLNEEATLASAESRAMRGDKHAATALLDAYLRETGTGPTDLRIQASMMRRRIADQVMPRSSTLPSESALIGRQQTMRIFGEELNAVKTASSRSFLLLGDAGIGKSRLLLEVAQFGALQGFAPIRVNCRPSHKHRPLSAFVELAPILRSMPGSLGSSPEMLHFLDRLTRHDPEDKKDQKDNKDPAWVYSGIQRALFDLIDAVADELPLLIQLEDVHWMDDSSAEILGEMVERMGNRRVAFALTGREAPAAWESSVPRSLRIIQVQPLDTTQSTDLALGILRHHAVSMTPAYLDWCVRVAEGNPYFLTELVNYWIESRTEHDVPPSLSSVLRGRLSRLDQTSLQVLQTCALLENNSTLPRLEAVLQHSAHELLAAINSLGSAGMLVIDATESASSASDHIATRHELLSNVALMELSLPARRFLHRRIGTVLESEVGENYSTATLWDCAKHWQLAGDNRRAWQLATSCASHLMKIGLPTAAAQAYSRSLAYCSTDEERIEILKSQTRAYYRMSDWMHVRETAGIVRTLQSRNASQPAAHDDVELMDLRAQWQTLNWDIVLGKALQCLYAQDASPPHRAEAGVMCLMLLGFKGDESLAKEAYETIESLVEDDNVQKSTALQAQMVYHTNFGDLQKGVASAHKLVDEQKGQADVADLFRAHCNAAVACRVAGLFNDAERHFTTALQIASDHNLKGAEQRAIPLAANMALEIGDVSRAQELYDRLCRTPVDPTNKFSVLERQALGARLALSNGDGNEARRRFLLSFDEACNDPFHHRRTYNLALHVATQLATLPQPSPEAVAKLAQSFEQSKRGLHQAFSAFVLATALIKCGDIERAKRLLRDYEKRHRREPWPPPVHLFEMIQRSCGLA